MSVPHGTLEGVSEQHEPECGLAGPCRDSDDGEHDYRWVSGFCRACERNCICRQLGERAARAVREYIPSAADGQVDAHLGAGQSTSEPDGHSLPDVRPARIEGADQ